MLVTVGMRDCNGWMNFIFFIIFFFITACAPLSPLEKPQPAYAARTNTSSTSSATSDALKIYVIDVGQGDATLVIGPSGRTLLIDAGPLESGQQSILPLLNQLQISHLSWILLTHYDADHIGGLSEVIRGPDQLLGSDDDFYPAYALYDRGEETDKNTTVFQNYVEVAQPVRRSITPQTHFDLGNGATARVIIANGQYSDGTSIHLNPDEENEASIGLLIEYGDFKYFTAGDLTGGGAPGGFESKDLETHAGSLIGDIDILHASHHGSSSSSNSRFLEIAQPEATLISVGSHNDYHHPAVATLQRLGSIHSEIFRTDLHGTIIVETDGSHYTIK